MLEKHCVILRCTEEGLPAKLMELGKAGFAADPFERSLKCGDSQGTTFHFVVHHEANDYGKIEAIEGAIFTCPPF